MHTHIAQIKSFQILYLSIWIGCCTLAALLTHIGTTGPTILCITLVDRWIVQNQSHAQIPPHIPSAAKSTSLTNSLTLSTNVSVSHRPWSSSAHPRIPVRGTAASFRMIRIWLGLGRDGQERTWTWRLVANGQNLRLAPSLAGLV